MDNWEDLKPFNNKELEQQRKGSVVNRLLEVDNKDLINKRPIQEQREEIANKMWKDYC